MQKSFNLFIFGKNTKRKIKKIFYIPICFNFSTILILSSFISSEITIVPIYSLFKETRTVVPINSILGYFICFSSNKVEFPTRINSSFTFKLIPFPLISL